MAKLDDGIQPFADYFRGVRQSPSIVVGPGYGQDGRRGGGEEATGLGAARRSRSASASLAVYKVTRRNEIEPNNMASVSIVSYIAPIRGLNCLRVQSPRDTVRVSPGWS